TPAWAALLAIVDQGRALAGRGALDGFTQTLPALYQGLPSTDYHDIVSGNNGYPAHLGYDFVTGIGSPYANRMIPHLVSVSTFAVPTISSPSLTASPANVTAQAAPLLGSPRLASAQAAVPESANGMLFEAQALAVSRVGFVCTDMNPVHPYAAA